MVSTASGNEPGGPFIELAFQLKKRAEMYLTEVRESLADAGVDVTFSVEEGDVASKVIAEAESKPDTLIAVTTHGRSGAARWVMGSVTSKILTSTSVPLLVLRTGSLEHLALRETLERVIVPLDGSEAAEAVLPSVAALASAIDLEVVLVRVTPSGGDYLRYMEYHYELGPNSTLARVYEGPFEEYSKESEAKAMEYLRKVTADLESQGVKRVKQQLLHGEAADAISAAATEMEHNLVAMTTHGRSGIDRWVMGSVTDKVVRECGDPVLIIRSRQDD
jgi:nucleotide-binding universal stress UspA family protein